MISCQINQFNKHSEINSSFECIIPTSDELNYETSQVKCPNRDKNQSSEKCQKLFKNIMALNVHLQMYHKETGIVTASNKYISRVGRYHCPIEDCTFYCHCKQNQFQSLSFSNFNAVRLHYLRQHGLKKEQCSKCFKSFGLHQDLIAHEKICGIHCPFSCSNCEQQFQNRTSLRRHQLKHHPDVNNEPQNDHTLINSLPSVTKANERRKRPNRRRPLPPDQIEFSRQNISSLSHQSVTINPLALELLKTFNNEPNSICSTNDFTLQCQPDSDKATQTYTRVSVGTECCSLANSDLNSTTHSIKTKTTEQKSSQTQSRIRMYKKRTRYSTKKTVTSIDDDRSSITFYNMPKDVFNASTMTQWENTHVNNMETQISSLPSRSDMSIQTVGNISNLLDYSLSSLENNHSVIVQTLPISMTSTQMQTITEYPIEQPTSDAYSNYLLPYQESVGTSCFLDEFLLDDLSKTDQNDSSSSVLFDFDAMDLLDLIDNGTQTYPLITTNETQTMTNWDNMLLNEDEWIRTMMNN